MTDEIDEILELLHNGWLEDDYDPTDCEAVEAKFKLLALKSKWEAEAYKKGYIDGGIDQLTTNGDKR